MSFQRARSDEQRDARRTAILDTVAGMLTAMPVAQVTLNEIARRVGLAKSNVLRYVESREAALLDLMHLSLNEWLVALADQAAGAGDVAARTDALAEAVATSLARRPVLCDLLAAQFAVLEHNVSPDLALAHKRRYLAAVGDLADLVRRHLPELHPGQAFELAAATLLCTGTVWTMCRPSEAVLAAYAIDPDLEVLHVEFTQTLGKFVAVLMSGVLARPDLEG